MKYVNTIAISFLLLSSQSIAEPPYSHKKQQLMDEMIEIFTATKEITYKEYFIKTYTEKYTDIYAQYATLEKDDLKKLIEMETRDYVETKMEQENALNERLYGMYDNRFTDDDLKKMIKFYKTDTGKKAVEILNEVLRDQDIAARFFGQELEVPVRDRISQKLMQENALNLPKE